MAAYNASATGEAAASGLTFSISPSGTNRGLVVGVHTFASGGGPVPSSVTYAGVAMAQVDTSLYGSSDNERLTTYKLEGDANVASGANDVVITVTGSDETVAAAVSVTDCHQTSMVSASAIEQIDNVTTHEEAVASAVGQLVVDFIGWFAGAGANAMTVGAGQTERVNNNNAGGVNSMAASTEPGAASVVMGWTSGAAEYSGHGLIAIADVAAAGLVIPVIDRQYRQRRS